MKELPDDATVVLWYGSPDFGGGMNGVFTVVIGKYPNWHKKILPAIGRLSRRLTGKPAWGVKNSFYGRRDDVIFSGAQGFEKQEAKDLFNRHLLKTKDKQHKWVIWNGKDFVDMETE